MNFGSGTSRSDYYPDDEEKQNNMYGQKDKVYWLKMVLYGDDNIANLSINIVLICLKFGYLKIYLMIHIMEFIAVNYNWNRNETRKKILFYSRMV